MGIWGLRFKPYFNLACRCMFFVSQVINFFSFFNNISPFFFHTHTHADKYGQIVVRAHNIPLSLVVEIHVIINAYAKTRFSRGIFCVTLQLYSYLRYKKKMGLSSCSCINTHKYSANKNAHRATCDISGLHLRISTRV